MTNDEALTASLEDYLEAIYHIMEQKPAALPKDIAKEMNVRSSSVTGALHALSERGLVNYEPYEVITLTPEGEAAAEDVVKRHVALRNFFVKVLCVDESDAEDAACKLEHAVPQNIRERFVKFVSFVEACPRAGEDWVREFSARCKDGWEHGDCEKCIESCLEKVRKENA